MENPNLKTWKEGKFIFVYHCDKFKAMYNTENKTLEIKGLTQINTILQIINLIKSELTVKN